MQNVAIYCSSSVHVTQHVKDQKKFVKIVVTLNKHMTCLFFVCSCLISSLTPDGVSFYNKLVISLNTSTPSKYVKLSVSGRRCISSSVNGQFVSATST